MTRECVLVMYVFLKLLQNKRFNAAFPSFILILKCMHMEAPKLCLVVIIIIVFVYSPASVGYFSSTYHTVARCRFRMSGCCFDHVRPDYSTHWWKSTTVRILFSIQR